MRAWFFTFFHRVRFQHLLNGLGLHPAAIKKHFHLQNLVEVAVAASCFSHSTCKEEALHCPHSFVPIVRVFMKALLSFKSCALITTNEPIVATSPLQFIFSPHPPPSTPLPWLRYTPSVPLSVFYFTTGLPPPLWSCNCSLFVPPLRPAALWNLPLSSRSLNSPQKNTERSSASSGSSKGQQWRRAALQEMVGTLCFCQGHFRAG